MPPGGGRGGQDRGQHQCGACCIREIREGQPGNKDKSTAGNCSRKESTRTDPALPPCDRTWSRECESQISLEGQDWLGDTEGRRLSVVELRS